jgi:hypothetical protein
MATIANRINMTVATSAKRSRARIQNSNVLPADQSFIIGLVDLVVCLSLDAGDGRDDQRLGLVAGDVVDVASADIHGDLFGCEAFGDALSDDGRDVEALAEANTSSSAMERVGFCVFQMRPMTASTLWKVKEN